VNCHRNRAVNCHRKREPESPPAVLEEYLDGACLRDDIKVLIAIVLRHKETLIRMLEQLTAMVAQNADIVDGLGVVEDRANALEVVSAPEKLAIPA
jgi:hypothetical protein